MKTILDMSCRVYLGLAAAVFSHEKLTKYVLSLATILSESGLQPCIQKDCVV